MKIKICGMKYPKNINDVGELEPDYMGFIFYQNSKRFVGDDFPSKSFKKLPKSIKKVGVFVNQSLERMLEIHNKYSFDTFQLHGNESVETCASLKEKGVEVIKVFLVDNDFDFEQTKPYESVCDFYLFDTKTDKYGGSGVAFNWEILENYTQTKPFFLSGGLGLHNYNQIKKIEHSLLIGLDFNSRLEDDKHKKIIEEVSEIINSIRN